MPVGLSYSRYSQLLLKDGLAAVVYRCCFREFQFLEQISHKFGTTQFGRFVGALWLPHNTNMMIVPEWNFIHSVKVTIDLILFFRITY